MKTLPLLLTLCGLAYPVRVAREPWRTPDAPTDIRSFRAPELSIDRHMKRLGIVPPQHRDPLGSSTYCHHCSELLIERDGVALLSWNLTDDGHCRSCGTACDGFSR